MMLELSRDYSPYYAERAGEKDRARQVGWRDRSAQHARFQQFVRAVSHEPGEAFRVADLGCGLGDLLPFLRAHGFSGLTYIGYDIIPGMVDAAASHHSDKDAEFRLIKSIEEVEDADYLFASGIFNHRLDRNDEDWWGHVRTCLVEMGNKSSRAAAFNMLSSYSDKERQAPDLFYADPCFVFDWCKREITPNVSLLHDYGQWDFTILLQMDGPRPGKSVGE